MGSDNARAVARKVVKQITEGKKVRKCAIIKSQGYSQSIAEHPHKVTNTKSYIDEISKTVDKLTVERDRAIGYLPKRIKKASYSNLITGIDILTKNTQLLSGHSTENKAILIQVSEQIANKNIDD